jgi:hypothetical protein
MKTLGLTALIAAALALPASAEEHRELGPHVHGHGTLNMAVENKKVTMELEVPGMDIVGFEHAASKPDQQAVVDKATATLKDGLGIFRMPVSAECKVSDAKVAIEAEHHHDGDEDHDDDHDGKEGHAGHNEFHVTYELDCSKPENVTTITFDYFKAFAGAKSLTVNVVGRQAQNSFEVTREKPVLDLSGMM